MRLRRWAGLLLAATAACTPGREAGPRSDGPIVLISIDTLRADHLPAYGYGQVATPAIDALVSDAVVFDHAYAHAPQTLPSHTSLLTGLLPFEHGVRDNIGFALAGTVPTLAEHLEASGLATGAFVSSYVLRREVGLARGFGVYDSEMPIASPEMSFGQVQRDGAESVARALAWIGARTSPRWFLFLHLYEPHKPYTPPDRYRQYAPYDGEIAYADELVGRLVADLKGRGLYDRATIVLLSDHGEGLGVHGEQEHGVFLYDETMHVPLVVKLPGRRAAGRRVAAPVQHIDVAPTLVALAGAAPLDRARGRSLVPLLGDRAGTIPDQGIYAESLYPRYHFGWSDLYALVDGRYRYIRAPREELYDLEADPGETTNLANARAQTVQAMRGALDRFISGRQPDRPSSVSAEDRERLAALGYVGSTDAADVTSPASSLADPKDRIATLEAYRRAVDLAGERRFGDAMATFGRILADNPDMKDVWHQLANVATRAGRFDEALRAYRRLVRIDPSEPNALLGVAAVQLRLRDLDDAAAHAEMASRVAKTDDRRSRATAEELLAKIALVRHDGAAALRHAEAARQIDPTLPLPIYVRGRLAHLAGRYDEALRFFAEAARQLEGRSLTITELHFYTGDTLARLGRNAEAEHELAEELRLFPQNTQAWASLALLYRSLGRDADVERVIGTLQRQVPTPDGYALAARLWGIFGEPARAQAVRADAARRFGRARG